MWPAWGSLSAQSQSCGECRGRLAAGWQSNPPEKVNKWNCCFPVKVVVFILVFVYRRLCLCICFLKSTWCLFVLASWLAYCIFCSSEVLCRESAAIRSFPISFLGKRRLASRHQRGRLASRQNKEKCWHQDVKEKDWHQDIKEEGWHQDVKGNLWHQDIKDKGWHQDVTKKKIGIKMSKMPTCDVLMEKSH